MRGTASRLNAVSPRAASASTRSRLVSGWSMPTRAEPVRSPSRWASVGRVTSTSMSASASSAAASGAIRAPAASYSASRIDAPLPAPDWTRISRPPPASLVDGVRSQRDAPLALGVL